jgi:GNAT superfamily N-acetyltransferase
MNHAHEWAADWQAEDIELNVFEYNRSAIVFYQSLDYETSRRRMVRNLLKADRR